MKKFYAITAALALCSSVAFAADYTVTPAAGTIDKLMDEVTISWGDATLAVNEENETDVMYGGIVVPFTVNGEKFYNTNRWTGEKEEASLNAEVNWQDDTQLLIYTYIEIPYETIANGYTFEVQFPANVVLIGEDKTPNEAFTLTYTVEANPDIILGEATANPASESTLTSPSPIEVSFKGEVIGSYVLVSYDGGDNSMVDVNPIYSADDDETVFSVNWASLGHGSGSYTITLTEGEFSNTTETSFNQEQSFTYTARLTEMASEPEGYSQSDDPMYPSVFIIFDEPIDSFDGSNSVQGMVYAPDGYEVGMRSLYLTNNPNQDGDIATGDADNNFTSKYDALMLQIQPNWADIFGSGEYTLSIGSVVMNSNGEVNKPFEYKFQVIGVDKYTPELSWDANTNTLNITSWTNADGEEVDNLEVTISEDYEAIYLNGYDYETSTEDIKTITKSLIQISGSTVSINLNSLELIAGVEYSLDMPEGFFIVGDGVSDYSNFSFTYVASPDAINTIESVAAPAGVYNLQGVKVGNSLEGLSKGIYIINGKKVIIK